MVTVRGREDAAAPPAREMGELSGGCLLGESIVHAGCAVYVGGERGTKVIGSMQGRRSGDSSNSMLLWRKARSRSLQVAVFVVFERRRSHCRTRMQVAVSAAGITPLSEGAHGDAAPPLPLLDLSKIGFSRICHARHQKFHTTRASQSITESHCTLNRNKDVGAQSDVHRSRSASRKLQAAFAGNHQRREHRRAHGISDITEDIHHGHARRHQ